MTGDYLAQNSDSKVLSRFKSTMVAVALVLSIGLHWPLLQSVAWVNMIVSFARQDGFEQAVVKTFSGRHPCKLCKLVEEGRKAEKKKSSTTLLKKQLDLFCTLPAPILFHVPASQPFPLLSERAALRFAVPSGPPPDLA